MIRVIDAPELLILAASTKSALAAPLRRAANEIDRLTTVNAALLAALKIALNFASPEGHENGPEFVPPTMPEWERFRERLRAAIRLAEKERS